MKLREILKTCGKTKIMYRTWCGPDDLLAGYCEWDGKELKSLDGDDYSPDDEIVQYEKGEYLTVWYESVWI